MARRAEDLSSDSAVAIIAEPSDSFDAWLHDLQQAEPVDLGVPASELVAEARAEGE